MSTFLTKVIDCCGNVTVITPCCTTPIVLEYIIYEDKITFTARGQCYAEFRLYVDNVDTQALIPDTPTDYIPPDCNQHAYKLVVLCTPQQESSEVMLAIGCFNTLTITDYELQDLNANDDPEVYLEWALNNPCPLITSYDIYYRPLAGAYTIVNVGLVTSYTLIDVPCGSIFEFMVVANSVCNTVESQKVYLFTGLCPCFSAVAFVTATVGDCFERYIEISFIPPLPPLLTVDIYRKLITDPDAAYVLIGQWGSNPFTDNTVTIGEAYTYKAVISGSNCLTQELTTIQTVIPDTCCDSCTLSLVANDCYVTATFTLVDCCEGVIANLYKDDGGGEVLVASGVTSPYDDYAVIPNTLYTYYIRGEFGGDCILTECSDTITATGCITVSNSGDEDAGIITQPHLIIVTFNLNVPACCLPDTATWNSTSPFLNILTAPTPLVLGANVCIVSANINGAPSGIDFGSIFVTTGSDLCGDDDLTITWEVE